MLDGARLRTKMVDGQVRPNDVTDLRLIDAMLEVPREPFMPSGKTELAYVDLNVPLAGGRALIQPMVLARTIQAADVTSTDKVLEIGAATGYSTALLARIAGAVTAVEEDPALVSAARGALEQVGASRVQIVQGPLTVGHAAGAPYDVIFLWGSAEILPDAIVAQLADGGRLLVVEGQGQAARAMLYTRSGAEVSGRVLMNAAVPPLPGFAREKTFVF